MTLVVYGWCNKRCNEIETRRIQISKNSLSRREEEEEEDASNISYKISRTFLPEEQGFITKLLPNYFINNRHCKTNLKKKKITLHCVKIYSRIGLCVGLKIFMVFFRPMGSLDLMVWMDLGFGAFPLQLFRVCRSSCAVCWCLWIWSFG